MRQTQLLYGVGPEVGGYLGKATVIRNHHQVLAGLESELDVAFLEYQFEVWLGDSLLAADPCFIVTSDLARDLKESAFTGFELADVLITQSEEFQYACPGVKLPAFERLVPTGSITVADARHVSDWSGHDICFAHWPEPLRGKLAQLGYLIELVVTERCLEVLRRHHIEHADITPVEVME